MDVEGEGALRARTSLTDGECQPGDQVLCLATRLHDGDRRGASRPGTQQGQLRGAGKDATLGPLLKRFKSPRVTRLGRRSVVGL
jgi:hypothetical protein